MRLRVVWSFALVCVACLAVGQALAAETSGAAAVGAGSNELVFNGQCDGSAAVILSDEVLLVANDRNNYLFEYELAKAGNPINRIDLHDFTDVHPQLNRNTSAFEALARVGDYVYVMGNHARQRKGVNRPEQKRFFAMKVVQGGGREQVRIHGEAFTQLVESIEASETLKRVGLRSAIMSEYPQLPYISPDKNGLDIQGLAAAPDDKGLLIALRNPQRGRSAILLPLENPADVVLKFAAEPIFGKPLLISLDGFGVSSMERSPARSSYLIVAGSKGVTPSTYKLFEWTGELRSRPKHLDQFEFGDMRAEGLVVTADGKRALVLSDDGPRRIAVQDPVQCNKRVNDGRCRCDDLANNALKSFRGRWIDLPEPPEPAPAPPPAPAILPVQ